MIIRKFLYTTLIAPRQRDEDIRNRELVLNTLLSGTLFLILLTWVLLVAKIVILDANNLDARVVAITGIVALVGGLYALSRRGWHRTASFLLVGLYFLVATSLVYHWGINIPMGILLYGLVVVLAGILLGPSYSLYAAVTVIVTMTAVHLAAVRGLINTDWSWTTWRPGPSDIAGYSFVLSTIALVSWLFNKQMAMSLHRAERAEAALLRQKDLLEDTVHERTQELQAVQLERIQQMYRFAELGQLSTALLHELANHLTTLTIDIEGLESKTRSTILNRAKRSIRYIDDMVVRVRDQLHGNSNIRIFNTTAEIDEIVKVLRHKAQAADVLLKWELPADKKAFRVHGEPIRLRQLMANLISNGIDAYREPTDAGEKRVVEIAIKADRKHVTITVRDWGRGISREDRSKLFEPFFSTKKTGMGMGLFIAKQISEAHFLGSIKLADAKDHTAFIVTIPRAGD